MFLELTHVPGLDMRGGPLGFAHVPWTLPLVEGEGIRARVTATKNAFITQHGPGDWRWRLVLEAREELCDVLRDPTFAEASRHIPGDQEKLLTEWLDLDSIEWPVSRSLSSLELSAARTVLQFIRESQRLHGRRPQVWHLADEQSRKNLARVAEVCELTIESPLQQIPMRHDAAHFLHVDTRCALGVPRAAHRYASENTPPGRYVQFLPCADGCNVEA